MSYCLSFGGIELVIAVWVCKIKETMVRIDIVSRDRATTLNLQVANEPVNELNGDDTNTASSPHSPPLSSRIREARD